MNMQALLDALAASGMREREKYHLTLGKLQSTVAALPDDTPVVFDCGGSPRDEHSYRGFYSDLAFEPSAEESRAGEVLAMCERAAEKTYQGYKGGDFRMAAGTPLWRATWGDCGLAITSTSFVDGRLVLVTRDLDATS